MFRNIKISRTYMKKETSFADVSFTMNVRYFNVLAELLTMTKWEMLL